MKEIASHHKDQVKHHSERQVEKKTVLLGTEALRPGHRCYEINTETLEVNEAQYRQVVNFNAPDTREVDTKSNCVYINAMNAKNALKVYNKGGRQITTPFMNINDLKL